MSSQRNIFSSNWTTFFAASHIFRLTLSMSFVVEEVAEIWWDNEKPSWRRKKWMQPFSRFNDIKEMKRHFWGVHLAVGFLIQALNDALVGWKCFCLWQTIEIEKSSGEWGWNEVAGIYSQRVYNEDISLSRDCQSINWWNVSLLITLIFLFIA